MHSIKKAMIAAFLLVSASGGALISSSSAAEAKVCMSGWVFGPYARHRKRRNARALAVKRWQVKMIRRNLTAWASWAHAEERRSHCRKRVFFFRCRVAARPCRP